MKNGSNGTAKSTAQLIKEEIRGEQQRSNRRANRHSVGGASYSDADPSKLLRAINNITERGCAVQFGITKDGSAFVVRIVGDGEPYNEFIRPSEDIDLYLEGLSEDFAK